jgi:hypothetical protein
MRIARVPFGWKPAVLVAIAAIAAACGSFDPLTSVSLDIYDSSVIQSPTKVTLDVFDGPSGNQIATFDRMASAQTSASSLLGNVMIVPGPSSTFGTLHIEGRRSSGGTMTSWGRVDVPLVANRLVSARLMLGRDGGPTDAGASGSGGTSGGLGGSGAAGSGAAGSGAVGGSNGAGGATPPADAGAPPVDGGSTLAGNGTACQSARTCASGFCADGVCCDSACDTLCHGCNLNGSRGTCAVFAAGSQCAPPSCTATSNDLIPARTCDSSGNCSAAGSVVSCGRYRCQNDACLRSCTSSTACVSGFRCFQNRCQ